MTRIPETESEGAATANGRVPSPSEMMSQADLEALASTGLEQAKQAAKQVERVIVSHPAICLGAAAVAGLVIGLMVKRR